MSTEDTTIDNCRDRQIVKNVCEIFPYFCGISPFALIIKPVKFIDIGRLMITPQQIYLIRIFDLKRKQ